MLKKIFYDNYGFRIEITMLLGLIILITVAVVIGVILSALTCNQLADINQSLEFNWTYLNGCLVRTEGMDVWIPAENIRTLIQ